MGVRSARGPQTDIKANGCLLLSMNLAVELGQHPPRPLSFVCLFSKWFVVKYTQPRADRPGHAPAAQGDGCVCHVRGRPAVHLCECFPAWPHGFCLMPHMPHHATSCHATPCHAPGPLGCSAIIPPACPALRPSGPSSVTSGQAGLQWAFTRSARPLSTASLALVHLKREARPKDLYACI